MRIQDLFEGGWDTTVTQSTVIKPAVVTEVLKVMTQFTIDFNSWLAQKGLSPVHVGKPTGSAAYYVKDQAENPDKIYGDVDLQMIAQPVIGLSYSQFVGYWNKLADEFVKTQKPKYFHEESKIGHPIVKIGKDAYVQVDFMWHEPKMSKWGAARATPEHNIKGLLFGILFSTLGEMLGLSIQHAGVQYKTQNGQRVPFTKQKDVKIHTISTDPETFIRDIFNSETNAMGISNPQVDPLLEKFPGNDVDDVKIAKILNGFKGLARSFELNKMYGKGSLVGYSNAQDFLNKFWQRYEAKAMEDVTNKKRDKAETPEAKARAESDKLKVITGLNTIKKYFEKG